jgi:hypothetical protein
MTMSQFPWKGASTRLDRTILRGAKPKYIAAKSVAAPDGFGCPKPSPKVAIANIAK